VPSGVRMTHFRLPLRNGYRGNDALPSVWVRIIDVRDRPCCSSHVKALVAFAVTALLSACRARADEPLAVYLKVGEVKNLCADEVTVCPISAFTCDDPKTAIIENGPDGAVLKGVSQGTTLCSVMGYAGAFRRVIRVFVN